MAADTYDCTIGDNTGVPAYGVDVKILRRKINLLDDLLTPNSQTVAEANDVFQLFNIPAKSWVFCGGVIPLTADGDTLTADLGDGDNVDGFVDGVDLNSTTAVMTVVADAYGPDNAAGKYYASADTVDLKIITIGAQTTHAAEFVVWIMVAKIPAD